jgi:NitT/TauT family transport system ATP-binding protein
VSGPLVSLRDVSKTFASGTLALDGLQLVVGQREFLTLLGPSGCGKSTALRLIAGLIEPSGGAVVWHDGKPPELGFVFQEPTLLPWAKVFDNVYLPLRLRHVPRQAARTSIEEALSLVGLQDFANAYPRELSGGMKMRVSLARALVLEPAILLLDEPFAALDEITRLKLNDDVLRLQQELGMTVVFVTHSVYESVYLSSRISVFSARPGRIMANISIDAPFPRNADFRHSQAYADYCRRASAALEVSLARNTQDVRR